MKKNNLMRKIAFVATDLDAAGFEKEANLMDKMLFRLANDEDDDYKITTEEAYDVEGILDQDDDIELDWSEISSKIKLSENFIRKHKDDVDWYAISANQDLSEEFIMEFKNLIDFKALYFNKNIDSLMRSDLMEKGLMKKPKPAAPPRIELQRKRKRLF